MVVNAGIYPTRGGHESVSHRAAEILCSYSVHM